MLWRKRQRYSVEEFALLMGEFDPIWVDTVDQAKEGEFYSDNGLCCWETSASWRELLVEAIKHGDFSGDEIHIVGLQQDDYGVGTTIDSEEVNLETWINTPKTRIRREALAKWLKGINVKLPYFMCSWDEIFDQAIQGLKVKQETADYTAKLEREAIEAGYTSFLSGPKAGKNLRLPTTPVSIDSDQLNQLEKLLNDEHQYQPIELTVAIRAWLGVTSLCAQDLNSASSIKQEVTDWLEEKAPEMSTAQKERIASMVNWDKRGGRPPRHG